MKNRFKTFYKLYVTPHICRVFGHEWHKAYTVAIEKDHIRYRCHCTRCCDTTFINVPITKKKVQKVEK